ncbi:hypothetical protein KC19_5G102800 [Ceratodon purpureus]|uniref:Uncharacterized protein n=1 Tax=Ceratodon purpureus TaxID=3225 RepID=A0A8T0HZW3_CERPU|nr:hypothetical protein KC19_5G102800 [Ceratodon purpureus]
MVDVVLPPFGGMSDTKINLYAVFDGHGGVETSQLASHNLHKWFLHHLHKRVLPSLSLSHSTHTPRLPSVGKDACVILMCP